jgi:hypothetical protein
VVSGQWSCWARVAKQSEFDALLVFAIARRSGLAGVTGEHSEAGHWLGTFAVYLETGRGLAARGVR